MPCSIVGRAKNYKFTSYKGKRRKLRNTNDDVRMCPYCQELSSRTNISRHITTKHGDELRAQGEAIFNCGYCKKKFRNLTYLQAHIKEKHKGA